MFRDGRAMYATEFDRSFVAIYERPIGRGFTIRSSGYPLAEAATNLIVE
jgi:hypothetical protein